MDERRYDASSVDPAYVFIWLALCHSPRERSAGFPSRILDQPTEGTNTILGGVNWGRVFFAFNCGQEKIERGAPAYFAIDI